MGAGIPHQNTLTENFEVDYVVLYRFSKVDKNEAKEQFKKLIRVLSDVGLQTEVRPGTDQSLLIFVKAQEKSLGEALYRSRVRDWLHGVRNSQPNPNAKGSYTPETDAERLLMVHNMITAPSNEGGAGITPKYGEWNHVDSVFPLHDKLLNKTWIKAWTSKTFLTADDLDQIRNHHGEKIGFYFAFLQSYFSFLVFPAAFGVACWVLLGNFSIVYAIVNCLSCVLFAEMWKRQERDLRIRWQVKNVSEIRTKRREFQYLSKSVDPATGEELLLFPSTTRLGRQLLQAPFAIVAVLALGTLIATCFAIEIFISEIYAGPFKSYLVFIPTILLSLFVPTISAVLTNIAKRLTDYENYETQDSYDVALTHKIFVLNFITSYLPIFLTAFVYVPCGRVIVPYLDVFHLTVSPFTTSSEMDELQKSASAFQINPSRLRKQVIYFTVTAQVVNQGLEIVLPYAKRKLMRKYQEYTQEKAKSTKSSGSSTPEAASATPAAAILEDVPSESEFLTRVRDEASLTEYDVAADLREMCVQFGYLSLFSVIWPLVPLSFLVNNWVELRSDLVKICIECRRPVPFRSDSIGSWVQSIEFLAWLGSITNAALVYMFSNDGLGPDGSSSQITGWVLLLVIFFAEHIYLIIRLVVQVAISKIETPATRQERVERYLVRKQYFDATPAREKQDSGVAGVDTERHAHSSQHDNGQEKSTVTRESLEEDARRMSQHDSSVGDVFWGRQRGTWEVSVVGEGIIEAELSTGVEEKKVQ
ncbi:plasma membrane channel protein [Blastomyces dermatitidis ER-3]|uniref:Plasma membrane channel protein n=1 Tax=Ajellomyces dermatitidis (strain ER-3 / ATCC MYA-2586) TaxID=559297 RepID=A0ABP2ERA9_AJEDR|nr:plasma membrane channel protein [Blastomyces dermatitidis ER-3]EEQ86196.1 plasma membrane channel protein [Blastomyces dermatitidis ER-3]